MLKAATDLAVGVLAAQAAACLSLAGVAAAVQWVVYPGLVTIGRAQPDAWPQVHAAHTRRTVGVVGPPWIVQGLTCAVLLVDPASGVPLWASLLLGALGVATVATTVGWAVPLHRRLSAVYDDAAATGLLAANAPRLVAWAAAGCLALALLL